MHDLEKTINAVDCDLVLIGTPIDLARITQIEHPYQRVTYDLDEPSGELMEAVLGTVAREVA